MTPVRAIHINHNISDNNENMIKVCINTCETYGIECLVKI